MKLTGAQAVMALLQEQGVNTVFGYPGGAVLTLYDALYDAPIRHILTAHEQGAAHAADGYARASGRVGVCIATSGPGATNLVTGLAAAFMDSVPVVAITGQVSTALLGRDAFQEVDITGVTMSVTKHNFLVKDAARLPEIMRLAFKLARSGRPGPVLVDLPKDIQAATLDYEPAVESAPACWEPGEKLLVAVAKAARTIEQASRPVLVAGGGVILGNAAAAVRELAEHYQLPVVSTLMGLGGMPADHPLFLGLTGMHGHKAANYAVHQADVVIAVGSRFSDRVTGDRQRYQDGKTLIHLDIDRSELAKNVPAHIGLVGELNTLLRLLKQNGQPTDTGAWWRSISRWQQPSTVDESSSLTAPWIMRHLSQRTKDEKVIFATDVGQHQMWAAQHLAVREPRTWLTSGGLGAMGYGLPAAMGAQLAAPDKRVIHIAGDGGFRMTGMELFTVATHQLPLISVIINNSHLGMIWQWQKLFYKERYSATKVPFEMDYVGFAKSCGVSATRVDSQQAFAAAFAAAWADNKPALIVADIAEDLVTPMLAPGGMLDEYVGID